ncbi:ubiquitin carboxyl-terminal hydrolase 2 [Clathrospora elynae]|uniref:ubiquitinyl hydrolase 1 n=1 Tax=Clathrospora elynae TaxID=706981 RepID=A0A6A5T3A2_9PLEO|nr:ubiquitin carboxyl-terminal hydrolase 2 [Clathrospora elynae]
MAKQTSPGSRAGSGVKETIDEEAMPTKDSANPVNDHVSAVVEGDSEGSTSPISNGALPPAEKPKKDSPNTRKRGLPEPSQEHEPSSKKSKDSPPIPPPKNELSTAPVFPSPADMPATAHDKETWQGFCDIESEPAYFSVILREMGVQGLTVREVLTMDQDYLQEHIPQPIYGCILIFHYREFGNDDQADECPKDVWFANQLPAQNSCATLAMINILMNSTDVVIGEYLNQFKNFTSDFTPYQRGEALASFDFVKRIHNSFAKKMDLLEGDKHLSYKVKRAERLKNELAEKTNFGKRDTQSRRASADSVATDDSGESHEENAHHFIAFVPVGNEVWKLDGLDAQPTSMGSFAPERGETWLSSVSDTMAALMAAGDDDYGVIALTQSPLLSMRKKACLTINTLSNVESRLDSLSVSTSEDWKLFISVDEQSPSPCMLGLEDHLPAHPVPASLKTTIDGEDMAALLDRRTRLLGEANSLAASIMMEIQNEAEEDQKATQRRYDSGPVIKKWLEILAQNGHLEQNLDRFMPKGMEGGK